MAQQTPPATPPMSMWRMLMPLLMMLPILILIFPEVRIALGLAAGFVLEPAIGFGGHYPLVTALVAGLIPNAFSTVLRHRMVDWLRMARQQHIQRAFQKELMEASRKQNTAKIKRLKAKQMEMSVANQEAQLDSMKPSLFTMLFFIMIFAWLGTFMYAPTTTTVITLPWGAQTDLTANLLFPAWVWLYMFLSTPVFMAFGRVLKYFSFTNRLRQLGHIQ